MPVHPSLRYWTEMNTGWALFAENNLNTYKSYDFVTPITYGSTEPSDQGLFYGIDEYVRDLLAEKFAGKYSPLQAALWLDDMAAETERHLAAAADRVKEKEGAEYLAMKVDLSMLCDFARYHGAKIRAATALALWRAEKEGNRLSDALALLDSAIRFWESLARKGRENYYHDLDFSSAGSETRRGTWGDLSKELLADRESLRALLKSNNLKAQDRIFGSYTPAPLPPESCRLAASFPDTARAGEPLDIKVELTAFGGPEAVPILHYRHTDQTEGLFHTVEMSRAALGYTASVPADYLIPCWDIQIYITIQGPGGCVMLPGIYHPVYPYPYHVIEVRG
jgi:hypothetical protein